MAYLSKGTARERFGARAITWGALLVALGIALSAFLHPGLGPVALPLNFVALLAGLLTGPAMGLLVGAVTPLLSALTLGMPPLAPPIAQLMAIELAVFGLVAGFLYARLRLGVISAVILANVAGRLAYGLVGYFLLPLVGLGQVPLWYPLTGAVVTGLPGLVAQLALVPLLVVLVERSLGSGVRGRGSKPKLF